MNIHLHQDDLPTGLQFKESIAIDTETLGLNPHRDRLCLVQIATREGEVHMVQFKNNTYDAPNLKAILSDRALLKIFHYARFDVAVIAHYLHMHATPLWCTKIASKLTRTYTDRHSLKDLVSEFLSIDLSKAQQSSDWASAELSDKQLDYAANDVIYLHRLREVLEARLARENRVALAQACFDFIPVRAALDLSGWQDSDIFAHN